MIQIIFGILWLIFANELIISVLKAKKYYSIQKKKNYIESSNRLKVLKRNIVGSILYIPICMLASIEFLLKGIYGWNHIENEYIAYVSIVLFIVSVIYYVPSMYISNIEKQKKVVRGNISWM